MQLFALKPLFALFMTTLKLLKGGNYVSQGRGNEVPTVEFHELGQKVRILGQGQEQDSSVD